MITIVIVQMILIIVFLVRELSIGFRHSYLRQKLVNRLDEHEKKIMDETDLDFWSFLK